MIRSIFPPIALAAFFLHLLTGGALAQSDKPSASDNKAFVAMARTTVIAVNHANLTGNYTVLRDLGAPGFSSANDAARLTNIFRVFRERKLNLGAVVLFDPTWTVPPSIDEAGMLRLEGYFPTQPLQLNFDLSFRAIDGRWRLFGITLSTS